MLSSYVFANGSVTPVERSTNLTERFKVPSTGKGNVEELTNVMLGEKGTLPLLAYCKVPTKIDGFAPVGTGWSTVVMDWTPWKPNVRTKDPLGSDTNCVSKLNVPAIQKRHPPWPGTTVCSPSVVRSREKAKAMVAERGRRPKRATESANAITLKRN